jgi:hypothetical protein
MISQTTGGAESRVGTSCSLPPCRLAALPTEGGILRRKRELIEPHKGDKRYVRRDRLGRFHEVDDVSRSLSQDVRRKAKTPVSRGHGDEGDRKKK